MLQITDSNDDYTVAVDTNDTVVLVWKSAATSKGMIACEKATDLMLSLKPPGSTLVLFTITFPDISLPEDDAVIAIAEYLKGSASIYRASVVLHLDKGWRAKIVAAMTWAIARAADYPFPHRPFTSLAVATRWLQNEHDIDGAALAEDIKDIVIELQDEDDEGK